jgi:hypothetical protein
MKITLLLFLTSISGFFFAQTPTLDWAVSTGNTGDDISRDIAVDSLGNVYSCGNFQGTVDFDPGPGISSLSATGSNAFFIQKLDANGGFLWAVHVDAPNGISGLTVDQDQNVIATGNYSGTADFDPGIGTTVLSATATDIFILKLNSNGILIWAKSVGGSSSEHGSAIVTDQIGSIYLTGSFQSSSMDFDPGIGVYNLSSAGSGDCFILSLDVNGNFVYAKAFGGTDHDVAYDIALDEGIAIYVTGTYTGTADFDPSIAVLSRTSNGGNDAFVISLDLLGNINWVNTFGGIGGELSRSIATDLDGNIYTAGSFNDLIDFDENGSGYNVTSNGSYDAFLLKLDLNGGFTWVNTFGSSGTDMGHAVSIDSVKNVYYSGRFSGIVDFDPSASILDLTSTALNSSPFIVKTDSINNFSWALTFNTDNQIYEANIALHDGIYFSAGFMDNLDADPNIPVANLVSNGVRDICMVKLQVCQTSTYTQIETSCDSIIWIDGNTYTSNNNTATHTLTNAAGCDSIVTLNLTINNSTSGTDTQTACESYLWIDGNTYTLSNNTATHTLTNAASCDSVITLDLIITSSTSGTDIQAACDSFLWIDGNTYTSSNNTATHTLTNAASCDSIVTLDLTINTVDSTVTQSGVTLSAVVAGASYQWLNCNNNFAIISGETNQNYTATTNGNYAVEITQNGCVDTSACYSITSVGIIENNFGNDLLLYPNPTNGNFSIDLGSNYQTVTITMTDLNGKLIQTKTYNESQLLNLKLEEPAGVYLLIIETRDKKAVIRLAKE